MIDIRKTYREQSVLCAMLCMQDQADHGSVLCVLVCCIVFSVEARMKQVYLSIH